MTDLAFWTKKAEQAVVGLEETDQQLAILKYKYECDKFNAKQEHSKLFHRLPGSSIKEREAKADIHADHLTKKRAEFTSLREYERIKNERESMRGAIEFWRSYQKAVNEGLL